MVTLAPASDPCLEEIVSRLKQAFDPVEIHLFGSRARGEAQAASDYDLLMVVRDSPDPAYRRIQKARAAIRGVRAAVDLLVMTQGEFNAEKEVVCSLPATVLREGRRLHAA